MWCHHQVDLIKHVLVEGIIVNNSYLQQQTINKGQLLEGFIPRGAKQFEFYYGPSAESVVRYGLQVCRVSSYVLCKSVSIYSSLFFFISPFFRLINSISKRYTDT